MLGTIRRIKLWHSIPRDRTVIYIEREGNPAYGGTYFNNPHARLVGLVNRIAETVDNKRTPGRFRPFHNTNGRCFGWAIEFEREQGGICSSQKYR